MSLVNWNKAPIGTTHVFVPDILPNPLHSLETWEKWDDESQEWDLMAYSDKLVNKDKRGINPNLVNVDE